MQRWESECGGVGGVPLIENKKEIEMRKFPFIESQTKFRRSRSSNWKYKIAKSCSLENIDPILKIANSCFLEDVDPKIPDFQKM